MTVTKELGAFLTDMQQFEDYERPPETVNLKEAKSDLIYKHALGSVIFEGIMEDPALTFEHDRQDLIALHEAKQDLSKKLHLIDLFPDFESFGFKEYDLQDVTKVEKTLKEHPSSAEEKEKMKQFLFSKKGGGGLVKCQSLSFLQGNMAYFDLHQ